MVTNTNRDRWCAPTKIGSICSVSARASMASMAPGAKATTVSDSRTWVVSAMTTTKMPEIRIAIANEPSAAWMWPSSTFGFIRANRLPISEPMPTSATPRTQGGTPPSTSPAPCSTLEAIIAPNIQLAGNLRSRRSSAAASAPTTSSTRPAGGAGVNVSSGEDEACVTPVSASNSGNAAVRMITRMVCTTKMAGRSAPRSTARILIWDKARAACEKR